MVSILAYSDVLSPSNSKISVNFFLAEIYLRYYLFLNISHGRIHLYFYLYYYNTRVFELANHHTSLQCSRQNVSTKQYGPSILQIQWMKQERIP
jgi:hypothetical protein